ncbi:MAG: hypothetical protein LBL26_07200 [Peptococcaceae bacterium]|jgi:hypothetical protein|nr:hypothetical protein [Peptococcaceae bacterium]
MRKNFVAAILMTLAIALAPFIARCIHKDASVTDERPNAAAADAAFTIP